MYQSPIMARRTVMLPLAGGLSALKEKRIEIDHNLDLIQSATKIGVWNHPANNTFLLDSDAVPHVNNAKDPGSITITFAQTAGQNIDRLRGVTQNTSFIHAAHATLDGYHPPGSGDTDLSKHLVVFDSATKSGQVIYVSGDGHVDLAKADAASTMDAVGLSVNAVTVNSTDYILTEGSVERSDWTDVLGSATLTPGQIYYLSNTTAGNITASPPTVTGYVVRVGRAITTTILDIEIAQEVRL